MKIILDGFKTKEQARAFLDWFEGQGEQDEGLAEMGLNISCDVMTGMIEHPDGYEYKVKIHE